MKIKKISVCQHCHFKTNEKNKKCPLCKHPTDYIVGDEININPTLPEKLFVDINKDAQLEYYCFKCRKESINRVCMHCNNVCSLKFNYNNKNIIVNRVYNLQENFNDNELDVILKQLTDQEKHYLYHNFEGAYRFFYHRDNNKAIACFLFAIFFYYFCLNITAQNIEGNYTFIAYIINALGNVLLGSLIIIGIWYLIDASNVEFKQKPIKIFATLAIVQSIQFIYAFIKLPTMKMELITGFIALFVGIIVYLILEIREKKHEK